MSLNAASLKNLPEPEKGKRTKKYFDGDRLYFIVYSSGSRGWLFKYKFNKKEKSLSLGKFPATSQKEARRKRDDLSELLDKGIDPSAARKANQTIEKTIEKNTFESVALEWWHTRTKEQSENYRNKVLRNFEINVFPYLGNLPIADIKPMQILDAMRRIENRGANETAHRTLNLIKRVYDYAIITERATHNQAATLTKALQPAKEKHYPSIIEPLEVGKLLRSIYDYKGEFTTCCALKLAPLFFVRPGELRQAEWKDFNFTTNEWRFTASKTKTEHILPLAWQAIEILKELHLVTGNGKYLFPSIRTKTRSISDNTLNAALRALGIPKDKMCMHGFRATARTMLDERLEYLPHIIEHQLAHKVKDPLGRAYNRTKHLAVRKEMMQKWADYLDELKKG